jgi:branched-chain amino acid transport system ATP-binding protein
MTLAYRIVRSEHYEINLVTRCLHNLADALHREVWQPDFDLLFLILHYVESFPATFHHPKEEDFLFKAVRYRKPETGPMLDQLWDDRAEGMALVSDLRQSLETYDGRPAARNWFHDAAKSYARHERRQMRREERTILPHALQVFSKEDWREIDAAFERNEHPLLSARRRAEFDKLFGLILRRIPGAVVFGARDLNRKKAA